MNRKPLTTMLINSSIVEWDIRHANTSLLRYYKLIPEGMIDKLEKYPKDKREIAVGLLQQKSKSLATKLERGFDEVMTLFIMTNGFDDILDILRISKDAAFVIGKTPEVTSFGPIEFVPKNRYHTFFMINEFEFYINDTTVDVKGLQKQAHLHEDGILQLIRELAEVACECNGDRATVFKFLIDMVKSYKNKELDFAYYREFNSNSKFLVRVDDEIYYFDEIGESEIEDLDISYNYINIILPLIRLFV